MVFGGFILFGVVWYGGIRKWTVNDFDSALCPWILLRSVNRIDGIHVLSVTRHHCLCDIDDNVTTEVTSTQLAHHTSPRGVCVVVLDRWENQGWSISAPWIGLAVYVLCLLPDTQNCIRAIDDNVATEVTLTHLAHHTPPRGACGRYMPMGQ